MNTLNQCHVLHLIGSSGLYGAEKWILAFMRVASKYNIKLSLINLTDNKNLNSEIVEATQKLNISAFDFYTEGRYNPTSGLRLGKWAKRNHVNIVHCHGYKSDTIGLIAARFAKAKIITTPHGWSREKDLKVKIYEKFDKLLFYFIDYICPLSPQLYYELASNKLLKNKTKLILNGVDIDEIDSVKNVPGKDNGNFVIGYVGQLIERKNIPLLLEAIRSITKKRDNIKLVLIGDGYLKPFLEAEVLRLGIQNHVIFHGHRRDVLSILKTLDLLALPSLMEGIPRCVMEAMASKIPVIASNIPGNSELITHGETGILFSPFDRDELSKNIMYVMDNRGATDIMVKKARQKIEQDFSNHRMSEEYIKLYNSIS